MAVDFPTSGDAIADRRLTRGITFLRDGDTAAAAALFTLAAEREPTWAAAWFHLGRARVNMFDPAGAADAFRNCLRLDPSDALGAGLELARIDPSVTVDVAPRDYIARLFDAYAPDFEHALVERLDYQAPQLLAKLVYELSSSTAPHFASMLDLGCGTGLAAEAFAASTSIIDGVDLSPGMLEEASAKGLYHALDCADIVDHLNSGGKSYDLIIAADVLIYFGALETLLHAIRVRLADNGVVAFTVERSGGADWLLSTSLRFAHSPDYIRRALNGAGLELVRMEEIVLRKDRGRDVYGLAVVARKSAVIADARDIRMDASASQSIKLHS